MMAFIPGTPRNDVLDGTRHDDTILGRDGNDVLLGRGGDDFLSGGDDNDRLFGDNGHDRLRGDDGNDELHGGNGRDHLNGGDGRDRLFGDNGDDTLVTDGHDRKLDGGRGTDTLVLEGDRDHHDHHGDRDHHDHHDDDFVFDLRGVATNIENIQQGRGDATVKLDTEFFLTADGDVKIDLDGGRDDTVEIFYDPRELVIDRQRDGDIVFGEKDGHGGHHNLNELTLVGVEHLEINGRNYDHWLGLDWA